MALPLWHTLNICFEIKLVGSKSKYYIIRQRKLLLQFNFTWTVQFSWKIYKGWINLAYFTEPLIDGYFHYLATSMKYEIFIKMENKGKIFWVSWSWFLTLYLPSHMPSFYLLSSCPHILALCIRYLRIIEVYTMYNVHKYEIHTPNTNTNFNKIQDKNDFFLKNK